jgi:hypothetical protein
MGAGGAGGANLLLSAALTSGGDMRAFCTGADRVGVDRWRKMSSAGVAEPHPVVG